ncbi:MAG TPA: CoA transferase [Candidatus Limnocylindria bacterium]|nr:CoA transferase [Candidatus Limnocylindria bacterium]
MSSNPERLADAGRVGPLSDLRVLELGTLIAGPFAGRIFADFGAEVIKVELPESGDPLRKWGMTWDGTDSLWHLIQSRGKLSVAADLHDPDDQAFVRQLAMESDILIENFRPGRLEKWNLGPEELIAANPRLIVVRISGYGQTGPMRDQPAFGTIAEAAAGLRFITGDPDRSPGRAGLSLGDSIASLQAVVGALIAVHERQVSGRGQVVDVALTEALFSMLEGILPEYAYHGAVRRRTGNIAHNSAPTNAYPCSDGTLVCIAANTTGLFRELFKLIGRDDLAMEPALDTNEGRVARAEELDAAITAWTTNHDAHDVVAQLRERMVPVSRINSIEDIVEDTQFRARDMIVRVEDDRLDRSLLVPGVVPKLSRTPGAVPALAQPLGAATNEVRRRVKAMPPAEPAVVAPKATL